MGKRINRITSALLIAAVVFGVQTTGAAPASTRDMRQTVTSPERGRLGSVFPRLRRFLQLLAHSADLIGPRP
jgi:hypothetical protein